MDPKTANIPSVTPQPIDPHYASQPGNTGIKKIVMIVVLVFVLIFLVVGGVMLYGRIQSGSEPKKVTLTYWGLWDEKNIMSTVIADFERENPHITVNYEMQDIKGLGHYADRLATRISNGTGPDIVRFHSSWTLQLRRFLLPFPQKTIEEIQLDKDFYKTVEKDLKLNGAYYGVPLGMDTLAMYVNVKSLEGTGLQIPEDWNDIYNRYAPELVVKDAAGKIISPSIALGTYDNISHAPDIVALLMLQNGADLYNLSGPTKKNADSALKFYTDFASGGDAVWDKTLDNSTLAFAKGNLPLYFGYSWDIFTIKAINPDLNFQVVKVPTLAGRNNTVASYWAEGVSAKTKNSKEAFAFLAFLSKPETLQKLHATQAKVRLFGSLYPRKSMAPLLSSNPLVYPFIAQADDAQSTFFSSDTYDGETGMITRMTVYLGNAVRSVNGNTSPSSAIDTLSSGVRQVLSNYNK